MSSRRFDQTRPRWAGRLSLGFVLGAALPTIALLVAGPHRRFIDHFVKEAAAQGWLLEGGHMQRGSFTSTIVGATLS